MMDRDESLATTRSIRGLSATLAALAGLTLFPALAAALPPQELPGWRDDDQAKVLPALEATCSWAERQPSRGYLGDRRAAGKVSDWKRVCEAAKAIDSRDSGAVRSYFEANFEATTVGKGRDGHISAYHIPALRGSWDRTERYNVPIYALPDGGERKSTRAQISAGALEGQGLEILWVDDAVAAYFMEIEGTGRVIMNDGDVVDLDFAGQNGFSYRDLGDAVADKGWMDGERGLVSWLRADSERAEKAMNLNPSKVFFKLRDGGAKGSLGFELTPGRSIAIDPRHLPLGVPVWVEMFDPETKVPGGPRRRLTVAQDTGGDIKGAGRADLFVGHGAAAAKAADRLSSSGRLTMLVPRPAPVQVAENQRARDKR
jgi:membrane-bound lytic murein transglycosylase A